MSKEQIASILRASFTIITALLLIPSIGSIPFIGQLLEAIPFIENNLDQLWSAGQVIVSFVTGLLAIFTEVRTDISMGSKGGVEVKRVNRSIGFGLSRFSHERRGQAA